MVNRLPPSVLLVGSKWKRIDVFGLGLLLDIEMPISFSLLVIVILFLLQLVQLMHFFQAFVIFAINRHVACYWLLLAYLLKFYRCIGMQDLSLFLYLVTRTFTCSL